MGEVVIERMPSRSQLVRSTDKFLGLLQAQAGGMPPRREMPGKKLRPEDIARASTKIVRLHDEPQVGVEFVRAQAIMAQVKQPRITMADVFCEVVTHFCVSPHDLKSETRIAPVARARHAFYWLCRNVSIRSYPAIARFINRDHSTVVHGIKRAEYLIAHDQHFRTALFAVRDKLESKRAKRPA